VTLLTTRRPLTANELSFVGARRVGRLATVDHAGHPSVVPICYAIVDIDGKPVIVSALDEKPKRVTDRDLARVRNIAAHPTVALTIDDYHEDWRRLAFVQLRGNARLLTPGQPEHGIAIAALRAKYPQYARMALESRVAVAIEELSGHSWQGGQHPTGLPSPPEDASFDDLIRARRSVRAFQRIPVPRQIVEQAIAAAGWAPSPHGRQPWRFAVVETQARREALATAMAASWREQLELDGQDRSVVEIRLKKSRDRLHDAPILVVVCLYLGDLDVYPDPERQAAETTMAVQSLGAAVQNLLLAIKNAGLDAGWMCAPLFCPDVVRTALGLDPALIPHALIPLGHAAKDPVRRERLPPDRLIVSWD